MRVLVDVQGSKEGILLGWEGLGEQVAGVYGTGRARACLWQAKNRGAGAPRRGEKKEGPEKGHARLARHLPKAARKFRRCTASSAVRCGGEGHAQP
jgi:hypothetical protein